MASFSFFGLKHFLSFIKRKKGFKERGSTQEHLVAREYVSFGVAVSTGGLNTSPEGLVRASPAYQTRLLREPQIFLFSGAVSDLDAFSSYQRQRSYPAMPCQTTGKPETAERRSSRTRQSCPSGRNTSSRCRQTVSRRSKPSSRIPLMGEQPHPWMLTASPFFL